MENINTGKKEEPAIVQASAGSPAQTSFKDLLSPKSPFQWVAFLVLIFGVVGGGAIGGGIGALIALKIYNLDRTEQSVSKKISMTVIYLILGSIAFTLIYIVLASLLVEYLPAE